MMAAASAVAMAAAVAASIESSMMPSAVTIMMMPTMGVPSAEIIRDAASQTPCEGIQPLMGAGATMAAPGARTTPRPQERHDADGENSPGNANAHVHECVQE